MWENYNSNFDKAARGHRGSGSTFKEQLKETPGQWNEDDGDKMFIIDVDTNFHHNDRLAVSILILRL